MSNSPVVPAVVAAQFPTTAPADDFMRLIDGADVAEGYALEKQKENLVGLPFVVTRLTFREGIPQDKGKTRSNYVSAECMVANGAMLAEAVSRGRLAAEVAALYRPMETVVYNDGSTGIVRHFVSYCHSKGLITVPPGEESGPAGTTRYDVIRDSWELSDACKVSTDKNDRSVIAVPVKLFCPRGLRKSDYASDYGDATTFYIG